MSNVSSSVHGILQARILDWLPFPSPGDLPNLGTKPGFESALYADPLPAATSQPPPPDFQLSHYRFLLVKF